MSKVDSTKEQSGCGARRGFGHSARFYERVADAFSGGLILQAKRAQLEYLNPGSKVLYLGVGAGEDAVLAAERGVRLTCVDISPGMLAEVQRKVAEADQEVELICQDALQHDRRDHYDVVTCNFFLNCFVEDECRRMLRHAASLVRPGGHLLIADVAAPQGSAWQQWLAGCYLRFGFVCFWLGGMVPWHGIYDYREYFPEAGLRLVTAKAHRLGQRGPVAYENLVAIRTPTDSNAA